MNDKIALPSKVRKHKWVTEAINEGQLTLSVWPSKYEVEVGPKQKKFLEVIAKVGNDPRVTNVEKKLSKEYSVVYIFHLNNA